jgi:hypothetical protein
LELRNVHVSYGNKVSGTHGDIRPITWAEDDSVYAAASDMQGCPEGLYPKGRNVSVVRVDGEPRAPSIHVLPRPFRAIRCRVRLALRHGPGELPHRTDLPRGYPLPHLRRLPLERERRVRTPRELPGRSPHPLHKFPVRARVRPSLLLQGFFPLPFMHSETDPPGLLHVHPSWCSVSSTVPSAAARACLSDSWTSVTLPTFTCAP